MDLLSRKGRAAEGVARRAADLDRLALAIHARPEVAFEEHFASGLLADYLVSQGVTVTRAAGGLATAFVAEAGSGGPLIALCAEYDALPGVGHACGHNIMGTAAVGAFLAVRDTLAEGAGRVRLIGCPAEERGNGKAVLIEAGIFDGVDAALMFHAGDRDEIDPLMLAIGNLEVELTGLAAHAAAEPHEGVNALDGLLLGWSAMSALRLTVRSDTRIHGIITDGGQAANIIPERAAARLSVRSPDNAYLEQVRERVIACFAGGARASGCELRHVQTERCDSVTTNRPLAAAFTDNAATLGRTMLPRDGGRNRGSTDMGNVSSLVPSIHPYLSILDRPTPIHSHAFAAAAAAPRALETMRDGATALAHTVLDAFADPGLIRAAWEHHPAQR